MGPILETISEATAPAALWFGSTLFSDLARRLRIGVKELTEEKDIYSPAFDKEDLSGLTGGIGKYHDRIIFKTEMNEDGLKTKLDELITWEKDRTLDLFGTLLYNNREVEENAFREFMHQYLQIHYVILPEASVQGNIIMAISPYLDALELMGSFPPDNANNPIAKMMSKPAVDKSASHYIRGSELFRQIDSDHNQFVKTNPDKNRTIRDINDIAFGVDDAGETKAEFKYQEYFAVVYADADGMGSFLKSISTEEVSDFSRCCLDYSKEAANLIGQFDGMTIYAGGDDLLFLAPVKKGTETIFDLCGKISGKFKESLEKEKRFKDKPIPTVSFGISIQYKKYPLYEALDQARGQLFGIAKHYEGKNCMAIRLEKHSGQSLSIIVGNECAETFSTILSMPEKYNGEAFLKSIGSSLEEHYALVSLMDTNVKNATDEEPVYSKWDNLFDNGGQKAAQAFLTELNKVYYEQVVRGQARISEANVDHPLWIKRENKSLNALLAILRMMKFFTEKSGGKEDH